GEGDDLVELGDGGRTMIVTPDEVAQPLERPGSRVDARPSGEELETRDRCLRVDAARPPLCAHAVDPDLVEFIERDERLVVLRLGNAGAFEDRRQRAPVIEPDRELLEPERRHHVADRRKKLRLDDERGGAHGVDVALKELAKAPARGPIGPPDGLNLIPLEEARQLVLVLRDHARERDGQVVAERKIGLAGSFVLAAAQDLENELVALLSVLPRERL